jgi:hypothetical protein
VVLAALVISSFSPQIKGWHAHEKFYQPPLLADIKMSGVAGLSVGNSDVKSASISELLNQRA